MSILCMDIGGSSIKYALSDPEGNLSPVRKRPTPQDSLENFLKAVCGIIAEEKHEGVAMSMPGRIDSRRGFLYTGGALPYNYGVALSDLIEQRTGLRPVIENDAKAATRAELFKGFLQGVESGAVLILGTGLGGGLVINGKLYAGPTGSAGELSNFNQSISHFADKSNIMSRQVCTTGLLLMAAEAYGLELPQGGRAFQHLPFDGETFFNKYHAGEEPAVRALEKFGLITGELIFNLCTVLDLQKVAIGGGISRQEALVEAIVRGTKAAFDSQKDEFFEVYDLYALPEIGACHFFNEANLLGALHCYRQYRG